MGRATLSHTKVVSAFCIFGILGLSYWGFSVFFLVNKPANTVLLFFFFFSSYELGEQCLALYFSGSRRLINAGRMKTVKPVYILGEIKVVLTSWGLVCCLPSFRVYSEPTILPYDITLHTVKA